MEGLIINIKKVLICTLIFPLQAYAGPYFSLCQAFAERTNELIKKTPIDSYLWDLNPTHCEKGNPRDAYIYTYLLKNEPRNKYNITKKNMKLRLEKDREMLRNGVCNDESLGPALNIIDVEYIYKLSSNETILSLKTNINDCKVGDLAKQIGNSGVSRTDTNKQSQKSAAEFLKQKIRNKSNYR